jgi:CubicO group peptidase (beta-lactamase class C family)
MKKYITCIILSLVCFHKTNAQTATDHAIDACVQKFMKELKIPGCAVAILKDNTVVKLQGYGMASLEFDVPVTSKTKFLLDSQTKLFTAIAMIKMQEEGKIKLDDSINLYLDSIPALWKNVTIINLLTHSSGIHDEYVPVYNDESLMEYSEQELYHHALQQPLDFAPGSRVRYNNLGFFLATVLIEKVSHVPYQKFMVDSFFTPLGLSSISFAAQKEIVKNYATAYALEDDKIVHMRDYALSQQGFSYMMKASIEELAQFDKLFKEGKVISKKSIDEMRKFFITNDNLTGVDEKLMQFLGIAYETYFMDGYTTYS